MSCFPSWMGWSSQAQDIEIAPETEQSTTWTDHFGATRLEQVCTSDKKMHRNWRKDRIVCPVSIQIKWAKPHVLELVNSESKKQDPIQVKALGTHTHHNNCFVHLHPYNHDSKAFCLSVVHQNKVFYIGKKGLTLEPQVLHVWIWKARDESKSKKKPHKPGEQHTDWVIITDEQDKYILQTVFIEKDNYYTIEFSSSVSKHLLDAAFLAAPPHDFVRAYTD